MDDGRDEAELARQARDGDPEALSALLERLRVPLFAAALAALRHYHDAQDAVAEVLVQVCRHVDDLREPDRVRSWAGAIMRNEIRRRRQRSLESPASEFAFAEPSTEADFSALRLDVDQALRRLPRDQGRAVALYYLAGLPVGEIARRTQRPPGTIKRWLHSGRKRLALELEEYRPMKPAPTAALVSSDLDAATLQSLEDALRTAGYGEVRRLSGSPELLVETNDDGTMEVALPPDWQGIHFYLLDEQIDGRSAFELLPLLRATPEGKTAQLGMLAAADVPRSTMQAAWCAGLDLFLTKPVDPVELTRFAMKLLAG